MINGFCTVVICLAVYQVYERDVKMAALIASYLLSCSMINIRRSILEGLSRALYKAFGDSNLIESSEQLLARSVGHNTKTTNDDLPYMSQQHPTNKS